LLDFIVAACHNYACSLPNGWMWVTLLFNIAWNLFTLFKCLKISCFDVIWHYFDTVQCCIRWRNATSQFVIFLDSMRLRDPLFLTWKDQSKVHTKRTQSESIATSHTFLNIPPKTDLTTLVSNSIMTSVTWLLTLCFQGQAVIREEGKFHENWNQITQTPLSCMLRPETH
jgi:hypothetical protein